MRRQIHSHIRQKTRRGTVKAVASFAFLVVAVMSLISTAHAAISNTATATGTYQAQPVNSNAATVNVPVAAGTASIGIVKSANPIVDANGNGVTDAGDTLSYGFSVTNLGTVSLSSIIVTDAKLGTVTCPQATLVPTQSMTCSAPVHVITQADMDAGSFSNQATVTGTTPSGATVSDLSDPSKAGPGFNGQTTVVLAGTAKLTLVKADTLVGPVTPGSKINYTFTVKNTGTVTIKAITLQDSNANVAGGPIASLAPNATDTTTFTASHTLVTADFSQPTYVNTATVSGTPAPPASPTTSASASVTTPLNYNASMTLVKTASLNNGTVVPPKAGDKATYSFTVTNTGNTPLHSITITDPRVASNEATTQHIVALLDGVQGAGAAELMTASFSDKTKASGIVAAAQRGRILRQLPPMQAELNVSRTLVRMSGNQGPLQSGEKIGFLYRLSNAGEVPLTSIAVAQPDGFAFGSDVGLLNPNETDDASVIFTRFLTPEEAQAGEARSNAYVTFNTGGREAMQQLTDTLPLSGIRDYDSFATASITPATLANLAAGAQFVFTAPYTLTQADIDAGTVHNDATATAKDIANKSLIQNASFDLPLTRNPLIGVVKTGTVTYANGVGPEVGDIITYQFKITNLGNVTLKNVSVSDGSMTIIGSPVSKLDPDVSDSSYTGQYQLVAADVVAGHHDNSATAAATAPDLSPVTAASDFADPTKHRPTVVSFAEKPAIYLVKQVKSVLPTHPGGLAMAGDVVTYAFTITNTGNVTLTNVQVTDPMMPLGNPTNKIIGGPIPILKAGAKDSTTISGTYTITQVDVDKGQVTNTATVTGRAPDNSLVQADSDPGINTGVGPTVLPLKQQAKVALFKKQIGSTDSNGDGILDAGDVLQYQFTVQNLGNVTLTNLVVTDLLASATVTDTNPGLTLAPNGIDGTTFSAVYTVTAADEKAGVVKNQAKVTANKINTATQTSALSASGDATQSIPGTTNTAIQQGPRISVLLLPPGYADTNNDGIVDAGDTLTYPIYVKNTGGVKVDLGANPITDVNPAVQITGPLSLTLTPGQEDKISYQATYVLLPADFVVGYFDTQVKVSGSTNPGNAPVQDLSDPLDYSKDTPTHFNTAFPLIAVLKTFSHIEDAAGNTVTAPTFPVAGDFVVYTITVKNTGNVNFSDVTIAAAAGYTDAVLGAHPFPLAVGAPADATHFTVRQPITAADLSRASIQDQVTAVGHTAASGDSPVDLSDPSSLTADNPTVVKLDAPGIAVIKTASVVDVNNDGANDAGDIIKYTFQVANIGNLDLTNVQLTDANAALVGAPIPLLKAGQIDTTTFTASHIVTAPEVASGSYSNQASASGLYDPAKPPVTTLSDASSFKANPPQPTLVPLSANVPVLTKTAARSQVKRGEVVPYTISANRLGFGPFQIADIMPPGFGYMAGSARVNGVVVTPVLNTQVLTFNNLVPVQGKITLTLNLVASVTNSGGKFVNTARLITQASGTVIAVAQATVEVIPEAVFDCSDIIGRVFDDLNANGYMDDGEPGLAGVRLATLNGQLITTDAQGRYHVPCAAIPDAAIGGNYLLKLDTRTLPQGYKLTTENPRDVRVTRGKVTLLNFGAAIRHDVKVDLTAKAFVADGTALDPTWEQGLGKLCVVLTQNRSALKIIYHATDEPEELAQSRITALKDDIRSTCKLSYALTVFSGVEGQP